MSLPSSKVVIRKGSVIEHDANVTFGLEELTIGVDEIRVRTAMGGDYRYRRSEVSTVGYGRWRLAFGKWFRLELANGTVAPIEFIVTDAPGVLLALADRGWTTTIE